MLKLLVLLLVTIIGVQSRCENDQVQCSNDRCVRVQYICDGDNDCGDGSDETSDICSIWRNSQCSRGQAYCERDDGDSSCVLYETYCDRDSSEPCRGSVDRRLCVIIAEKKLQPLADITVPADGPGPISLSDVDQTVLKGEDFLENIPNTLKHDDCPQLYTKVGEHCFSLFFFGNLTWGEARSFCKTIGGDLTYQMTSTFSTHWFAISRNTHVSVHPLQPGITANFWMGGTYNATTGWKWVNENPIDFDSANWATRYNSRCESRNVTVEYRNVTYEANQGTCYHYSQAPGEGPRGGCIASTFEKYFLLSDEDCLKTMSPICKLQA